MTKYEVQTALKDGHLWAALVEAPRERPLQTGRWWKLRANGATTTWKSRPRDFSIPVKCGLKTCTRITHADNVALMGDHNWQQAPFLVSVDDPNNAIVGA